MVNEISQRYAQGLFELANENGTVKEKKDQAEALVQQFDQDENLGLFFRAVKITKEEKKKFIDEAFGKYLDTDMSNFLKLIIDKGRNYYIEEVLKGYLDLANDDLGIVSGTVSSARPLSKEDIDRIAQALKSKTGKEYILHNKIDPSLIAGIKVTAGSAVTDITMKSKIEDLRKVLLKGGQA